MANIRQHVIDLAFFANHFCENIIKLCDLLVFSAQIKKRPADAVWADGVQADDRMVVVFKLFITVVAHAPSPPPLWRECLFYRMNESMP